MDEIKTNESIFKDSKKIMQVGQAIKALEINADLKQIGLSMKVIDGGQESSAEAE